jgi:hypothetical protein
VGLGGAPPFLWGFGGGGGPPPAGRRRVGYGGLRLNYRESMATPCHTPMGHGVIALWIEADLDDKKRFHDMRFSAL